MASVKQERDKLARQMERLAAREAKAREAGLKSLEKLREKHAREAVRLCQRHAREVASLCKKVGLEVGAPACAPARGCGVRLRFKPFEGWSGRLGSGGTPVLINEAPDGRILRAYNAFRRIPEPEDFNNRVWFAVRDTGEIAG